MQEYFISQIRESLKTQQPNSTRIEVHLKDENRNKDGFNAIFCLFEARLEGRQPIQEDSFAPALTGAIAKIEAAIETTIRRIKK